MRCSYYTVGVTLLLLAAPLFAGGNETRQASFHPSPVRYMRGSNGCGCGVAMQGIVGCDSRCESGCGGGCRLGIPPLLPALMNSVDCLLQRLYYNPCNVPCVRQRCRPARCSEPMLGFHSGCGCHGESYESRRSMAPIPTLEPQPETLPTNPFKDDELRAPPSVPKEIPKEMGAQRARPKLQPVEYRQPKYSAEPTVVVPVKIADSEDAPRSRGVVRQVVHETNEKSLPSNPLRNK